MSSFDLDGLQSSRPQCPLGPVLPFIFLEGALEVGAMMKVLGMYAEFPRVATGSITRAFFASPITIAA